MAWLPGPKQMKSVDLIQFAEREPWGVLSAEWDGRFRYEYNWPSPRNGAIIFLQYIGIKDKNNTDIFESNIVKVKDIAFEYEYIGVIKWDNEMMGFVLDIVTEYPTMNAGIRDIRGTLRNHTFEVVGNIYQNPELLVT